MRGTQWRRRLGVVVGGIAVAAIVAACGPAVPQVVAGPASCNAPYSPPTGVILTIFNRVNSDRAANGLGALRWNRQLTCLAFDWSTHMAATGNLTHRDLNAVIRSTDYQSYRTIGENILRGPASLTGDAMEDAWMASPGHRANILSPAFTSIGISFATTADGSQVYATQNFGG